MILVDSSVIVAYADTRDENHEKATKVIEEIERGIHGSPVITDHIFGEVVTVALIKSKDLKRTVKLGKKLLSATEFIIIDELLFERAWELFEGQKDIKFSFTDCTTLAVSEMRGISRVATFDKDFRDVPNITVVGT